MKSLLCLITYIIIASHSICLWANDQKSVSVSIDSVSINQTLLCVLDSMVSNNCYVCNLTPKDRAEYEKETFIINIIGSSNHKNIEIITYNSSPVFYSQKTYAGYFKYKGHSYFLTRKCPNCLYKKTKHKLNIQTVRENTIKYSDIKNLSYIDDEPMTCVKIIYSIKDKQVKKVKDTSCSDILEVAEHMPTYKDGMSSLKAYIENQKESLSDKYIGRAFVEFVVEKDGTTSGLSVVKNQSTCDNNTIMNIFKNMGLWNPGIIRGKKCRIRFKMPVLFDPISVK